MAAWSESLHERYITADDCCISMHFASFCISVHSAAMPKSPKSRLISQGVKDLVALHFDDSSLTSSFSSRFATVTTGNHEKRDFMMHL